MTHMNTISVPIATLNFEFMLLQPFADNNPAVQKHSGAIL